jgi:glutaminyl-peptide cyclotransferase
MRRQQSGLRAWLRPRWLEVAMLIGLGGILLWFGLLGYSFAPKPPPPPTPTAMPAPTDTPAPTATPRATRFDGAVAVQDVLAQTKLGPRAACSEQARRTGDYIAGELRQAGWQVEFQNFNYQGVNCRNIFGKAGQGMVAVLATHYDTRPRADRDPDPAKRNDPVLGANGSASGVAVLLEIARTVNIEQLSNEVWLAFFDAEESGGLDGWEAAAGARYAAGHLSANPQYVINVDTVGDAAQQIYRETTSTPELTDTVWAIANQLGYGANFLPDTKWTLTDDHTPFVEKGIPALTITAHDYPAWRTTEDTADKVSTASLERVGRVLQAFLEGRYSSF